MPTALQNTEVETSLTQQAESEEGLKSFNPLDGELIEDDDNTSEEGEEAPSEESDSEEEKLPEGDLVDDEAEESEESEDEDEEETEEEAEEESPLSATLKKATERVGKARDYSRFSAEDAKYLKQMSNEAFEHFAKKTEETSALQQKLDSTSDKERVTADHPDSYILSEDYKEIYGKLSQAQQEQQHWQ